MQSKKPKASSRQADADRCSLYYWLVHVDFGFYLCRDPRLLLNIQEFLAS